MIYDKPCGDCSYFKRLGKEESLKRINSFPLKYQKIAFVKKVAPDYIKNEEIDKWRLWDDLGWL